MRRFILFVLVVALCVYGLYRWTERRNADEFPEQFTPAAGPKLTGKDVEILQAMEDEYTRLVQVVVPSVVSITATKRVEAPAVEDPFELFFGRRFARPRQTEEMRSLGSGVIVSREGHIVTNQHVVADVDEVRVRLSNGQEAAARIIGADPVTDIAVLKVTGLKVTPLAFIPDSDKVKVGQRVIAVGNPFGFDETVTQGIISAKGRAMEDSANDFFQTDAAINPGNSGGPLVDLHGEIIGINAAIYAGQGGSGSWQGLGFAIPANTARRALEAIIKTGHVPHGYLGVNVLSPELLARMGLPQIDGAYVNGIVGGSPAEAAGIQKGDIITAIGQHPIHSFSELRAQVANVPSGTDVPISIQRDNQTLTLTARITDQPANPTGNSAPQPPQQPQPSATQAPLPSLLAGVHVMEIPPDHEEDLPPNAHGVMVSDVDAGTPAAGALQQSDVIEEIDRVPIHSVPEYNATASAATGARILLSICRERRRSFAVITAH
ncbi:MAG TPA: trypsin-like peptidase domain-containing protein [Chthoniobacteraceae bacterium]|jgi:Do/DeqQ family serine protease|nr:trypsin-like peptidase domain-containing protein [Chthoniobacteraceae bacterium]